MRKLQHLKRLWFLFTLSLCCVVPAQAAHNRIYSLHGGWSLDQMTNSALVLPGYSVTPGTRSGIALGVESRRQISELFWFQMEINYVARGFSLAFTQLGQPILETAYLDYIELPLLLRMESDMGGFVPSLLAGLSIAFPINQTVVAQNLANGSTASASSSVGGTDLGLYLGGGVAFPVSDNIRLGLEARYYLGMLDVSGNGTGLSHRNFLMLAGVSWELGGVGGQAVESEDGQPEAPTVHETPQAPSSSEPKSEPEAEGAKPESAQPESPQ